MSSGGIIDRDLRTLADHLPFDVWVRDREHRLVYANPQAQAKWAPQVGSRPEDHSDLDAETLALWLDNNRRALAGEVVRGEVSYHVGGRERRYLNIVAPIPGPDGPRGTVGVNIDVTELRDSEARAALLDRTLRDLFAHAPIAIGIRALRGDDLLHVEDNARAAAMLGTTPDAIRGRTDREIGVPEAQVRSAIELYRRAASVDGPLDFELRLDTREGPRVLVGKVAPLPREHSGDEHFAFFGEDVTRLRELEAKLTHADRLASLGVFAASIGHEIKNPAAYALANLELLVKRLDAGSLDDAGRAVLLESARTARFGLERIVGLVGEMMQFASPRDGVLGPVSVRDVVDSVVKLAAGEIRDRVRLVRKDGDVPAVFANTMRLAQVVLNLVSNAIQAFGERRGTLWIETESISPDRVRLTIADNGPGVPAEVRARLFQPFVTSGGSSRTGLGLYVSNEIVKSMNGVLTVTDRSGGGSVFQIDLPVFVPSSQR